MFRNQTPIQSPNGLYGFVQGFPTVCITVCTMVLMVCTTVSTFQTHTRLAQSKLDPNKFKNIARHKSVCGHYKSAIGNLARHNSVYEHDRIAIKRK